MCNSFPRNLNLLAYGKKERIRKAKRLLEYDWKNAYKSLNISKFQMDYMDISVKIKKEGGTFLASCEEFGLFAEDSDKHKAVERIREAFYFSLQSPDFIEGHKEKLNKNTKKAGNS